MTAAPTVVWLGDALVPYAQALVPVEDRGLQFGESLYEVVPITAGRARALPEHGARMRAGAERIGLGGAPDDAGWERIVAALLEKDPVRDALLYAQLTGGAAPRVHAPADRPSPTFFAYVRAFDFPDAEAVETGIKAATVPDARWAHCDIKTTMLLPAVLAKYEARARGADEALFVADGQLREGSSSNAFIVEKGSVIGVPQTASILPGITRALLGRACDATGTGITAEPISVERMLAADEVFVTSTSRLVMPVVEIDGCAIGNGRGGPVSSDLAAAMRRDLELD
jgi:D-alanine transaminase